MKIILFILIKNNEFDEEFKEGNILIKQTKNTGKCLDSAFLFGNKNNKTFVGLQMKNYDKSTPVSSSLRDKLKKHIIKSTCSKLLSNIFLKLGINVTKWYYILILYINFETKTFNTQFISICNNNDLAFLFYDPIKKLFYDKNLKEVKSFKLDFFSNLGNNDFISNATYCLESKIDSYEKERAKLLEKSISPRANALIQAKRYETFYNLSFEEFLKKIKKKFKAINKIIIISSMSLDINQCNIPVLKSGYGYIFINNSKNGFIFEGKSKEGKLLGPFGDKNSEEIIPIKLVNYIDLEEKSIYFIVKF